MRLFRSQNCKRNQQLSKVLYFQKRPHATLDDVADDMDATDGWMLGPTSEAKES